MDLTHSKMRDALGVSATSLENWLRRVPRQRAGAGRANDPYMYDLADVVPALRCNRAKGLSGGDLRALCDLVHDQSPDTALADADTRSDALLSSFNREEAERLDRCMTWAAQGAVYGLFSKLHHVNMARSLRLLAMRQTVLRYVLTAERSPSFPTTRDRWAEFVIAHIKSTATPSEIKNLNMNMNTKETRDVG
jgi:hypothetical protein